MPQPSSLSRPSSAADAWGEYVASLLMVVAGLIGLFMAAGARDDEIYVFGLSLAAMATVFVLRAIKRHYDAADMARAELAGAELAGAELAGDRHG